MFKKLNIMFELYLFHFAKQYIPILQITDIILILISSKVSNSPAFSTLSPFPLQKERIYNVYNYI